VRLDAIPNIAVHICWKWNKQSIQVNIMYDIMFIIYDITANIIYDIQVQGRKTYAGTANSDACHH
jgi:hypothetical protein